VRFVGIDLAWGDRGGTGLCAVEAGRVLASARVTTDAEIIEWVTPYLAADVLAAIDAPLIVTNTTGRRPCERAISHCFGAHHAGAHSSNLGLPAFAKGVRGERIAKALGLNVDPTFEPRSRIQRAIEVYPHPAIVALFDLQLTLKYKAKRGRTTSGRCTAFRELLAHLEALVQAEPPLDVSACARWEWMRTVVEHAPNGAALDRAEDELDAYVCAYVAHYYWTHGTTRCRVVGDLESGYIVTPVSPAHARCLDAVADATAWAR
jgi:predicted RNase H-like nuclease